jgi:hypothetical protein
MPSGDCKSVILDVLASRLGVICFALQNEHGLVLMPG